MAPTFSVTPAETAVYSRYGTTVNRAGRDAVAGAMRRLLDAGARFAEPDADVDTEQLRDWAARLRGLAMDLADCVEAPVRNRVMELLDSPSIPDDADALCMLRINVAGASFGQLGKEVDVAGRTVERVESGQGCQVNVAKKLADRFSLGVSELFDHGPGESFHSKSVAGLRDALTTPLDEATGLRWYPGRSRRDEG